MQLLIGREYPKVVTPLIEKAQFSLEILVFDWRWYRDVPECSVQKFNHAIMEASKRGVKVRALVNNSIMPTILQLEKLKVKRVGTKKLMHVKMIIIDRKTVVIGSHNFTYRAFEINHETSIIVEDKIVVDRLLDYFEKLCRL
jgi:phosphatidylserine/phosphatidylglycerophosphate/cardiolipin synthase-like enzyme